MAHGVLLQNYRRRQ